MKKIKRSKGSRRRQARLPASVTTRAASLAFLTATSAGCIVVPPPPDTHSRRATTSSAPAVQARRQAPAPAAGAAISDQAALDKYFLEGYDYCDAEVLAAFWGLASPYDAKVRLGQKMLRWGPADADSHLPDARAQALGKPLSEMPCWYADYGYSFNDAEILAAYWGQRDVGDAKLKMTRLLIQGKNADLQAALRNARARSGAS